MEAIKRVFKFSMGGIVGAAVGAGVAMFMAPQRGEQLQAETQALIPTVTQAMGPLTVLGSIEDGLSGDYSLLAIKSMLDGFAALAFASSLGVGVLLSAVTVLLYQGGLTLLAGVAQRILSDAMITEMSAVGGIMIVAIGLLLLDLKRVRVANMLPGLLIAPLVVALLHWLGVAL